jgi:TrmH family RNA methyltransferase
MITRADIQLVRSLADKRARTETGLFVAEGAKLVGEIAASSLRVRNIYSSREFAHPAFEHATAKELERLSLLKTPSDTVAVVEIPHHRFDLAEAERGLVLALDEVQNPGNMGTIIRLADWFGISDIICTPNSADCFNPKVVQATMGAILRVRVHYLDLASTLSQARKRGVEVYGTFLE